MAFFFNFMQDFNDFSFDVVYLVLEKLSFKLYLLSNQSFNTILVSLAILIKFLQSIDHLFAAILMLVAVILKLSVYFKDWIVAQEVLVAFHLLKRFCDFVSDGGLNDSLQLRNFRVQLVEVIRIDG